MTSDYLRVVPTSANLELDSITTAIKSLHKICGEESGGLASRLNPFRSEVPPTFESVAISEGKDEPVEFYYGADAQLEVLQQRLRSIYPDSFDIDRVEVNILEKLIQPVEYRPREFNEQVEEGLLLRPDAVDSISQFPLRHVSFPRTMAHRLGRGNRVHPRCDVEIR